MTIVDVTTSTRPKVKQHQPGMGFKTLAMSLNPAPPAELSNIVIVRIT